jgi:hypothetical protein
MISYIMKKHVPHSIFAQVLALTLAACLAADANVLSLFAENVCGTSILLVHPALIRSREKSNLIFNCETMQEVDLWQTEPLEPTKAYGVRRDANRERIRLIDRRTLGTAALVAAICYPFSLFAQNSSATPRHDEDSVSASSPFSVRLPHSPIPLLSKDDLEKPEIIGATLWDAVTNTFDRYRTEIAIIDLSYDYQRQDLTDAVAAFLKFLDAARHNASLQIIDVKDPNFLLGIDQLSDTFSYSSLTFNQVIPVLDTILIHEIAHFLLRQQDRNVRLNEIKSALHQFVNEHRLPAGEGRTLDEVISLGLWDFSALQNNPFIQGLIAEFLKIHWQNEDEASQLQISLLTAEHKNDPTPVSVVQIARERPRDTVGIYELENFLAANDRTPRIAEAGLNDVLRTPPLKNYFIALRQTTTPDRSFNEAAVARMWRDPRYFTEVYRWAEATILKSNPNSK